MQESRVVKMARTLPKVYRTPGFLLVSIAVGLIVITIVHVALQGRLELSQLLPFYTGWALAHIIVWIAYRKKIQP